MKKINVFYLFLYLFAGLLWGASLLFFIAPFLIAEKMLNSGFLGIASQKNNFLDFILLFVVIIVSLIPVSLYLSRIFNWAKVVLFITFLSVITVGVVYFITMINESAILEVKSQPVNNEVISK